MFLPSFSLQDIVGEFDLFAGLIAAAIHDVGHPGHNNNFEIAIQSDLAITYNDQAVLENYHLATTFSLLKVSTCCNTC